MKVDDMIKYSETLMFHYFHYSVKLNLLILLIM